MSETKKTTKNRSPEHPAIGLEEAIERARAFYQHEHFNKAPVGTALEHWGYAPKSGTGFRVLGALRHFGLLEEEGKSDKRTVWISERGKALVLKDRGDPEWDDACRDAALAPAIHAKLWGLWGENGHLPSDRSMRWELETQQGFNPNAIEGFVSVFRATLRFANLLKNGTLSVEENDSPGSDDESPTTKARPPRKPPEERRPMPPTGAAATKDWDLTVPLMEGGQAVLRVPIPLSEEDFTLLKSVITANLDALKASITRKPSAPSAEDEG